MDQKNDGINVIRTSQELRVEKRREALKERQPNKDDNKERSDRESPGHDHAPEQNQERTFDWWSRNLDMGRLLVEKGLQEQTLIALLTTEPDIQATGISEADRAEKTLRIEQLRLSLAEIEKKIALLENREPQPPTSEDNADVGFQLKQLEMLEKGYTRYLEKTYAERDAIDDEDIDRLENLMSEKRNLLDKISQFHLLLNLPMLRSLPEESDERTKANGFLTDINMRIREIIDQENLNSVELQKQKEAVRRELDKFSSGTKLISKYSSSVTQSRLIDTTK